jgi:hypothetical protein
MTAFFALGEVRLLDARVVYQNVQLFAVCNCRFDGKPAV